MTPENVASPEPGGAGERRPAEPGVAGERRLVERGEAGERRPVEPGSAAEHCATEVDILQVRGAEVEIACGPAIFVIAQVIGDDSHDCRADLFVVLTVFEMPLLLTEGRSVVAGARFGENKLRLVIGPQLRRVGQPQVAAENVDALLTAKSGGFVGDTGHRIHAGDTHGDIVVAELSRGRAEPLHEPPLLDVPLPPVGNDESDGRAHAAGHRERQLRDVDRVGFLGTRVDQATKNPGCQQDYRDGAGHGKTDRG